MVEVKKQTKTKMFDNYNLPRETVSSSCVKLELYVAQPKLFSNKTDSIHFMGVT